jgi:hypothetical protein
MENLKKYAKLLGVDPNADLSEVKLKYAEWRKKFETMLRSEDIAKAQKGQKNLALLDQAYQALAAHAVTAIRNTPAANEPQVSSMSIEIGSCRVGYNINNIEGFQFVNKWKVRRFKVSWPGAKITFYNNKLKIKGMLLAAEMEYRHIENIKRFFYLPFVFEIKHRSPDVLPTVILSGFGLGGVIKRLNDEHHLDLPITY